jgi:hypothetical protein
MSTPIIFPLKILFTNFDSFNVIHDVSGVSNRAVYTDLSVLY